MSSPDNFPFPYSSPPPPTHPFQPPPRPPVRPPPPPPPHVRPSPPPPLPPAPSPSNNSTTTIVIVFVSFGGVFFLAFLAVCLCCFLKKKKKKKEIKETDLIHVDEHKKIKEAIVEGPHGPHAIVLEIEDDVHVDEVIKKEEKVGQAKGSESLEMDAPSTSASYHSQLEHKA